MDFSSPLMLDDCNICFAEHVNAVSIEALGNSYLRLVSVCKGNGYISFSGDKYEIRQGFSVLLLAGESPRFLCDDGKKLEFDVVGFEVPFGRYKESFDESNMLYMSMEKRIFSNPNICITARNICGEFENEKKAFSKELVSLLLSQLLVYIVRCCFDENSCPESNDTNFKVCEQVMNFIDNRIYTMRNLGEVATSLGYNYSYISTLFHRTVGVTLNTYFKTKRMDEARKLLQNEEMSISEIARVMNYSSVYAFSKAFKEHFGASPGRYSGRFPNRV